MLDFQKLDPFWNLWGKLNPGISSKMLYPAQLNCNLERKIGHVIFLKTEKTEYLSNQLTYAHFDRKFIFLIQNWTFEQIFIFRISKMFQISGTTTVVTISEALNQSTRSTTTITGTSTSSTSTNMTTTTTTTPTTFAKSKLESAICNTTYNFQI